MEDRVDAGLWLEPATTSPKSPPRAVRAGSADGNPESERFCWWENACPDRRSLHLFEVETDDPEGCFDA
jgi:hypothetical protein